VEYQQEESESEFGYSSYDDTDDGGSINFVRINMRTVRQRRRIIQPTETATKNMEVEHHQHIAEPMRDIHLNRLEDLRR
jgi:hypothetical protein